VEGGGASDRACGPRVGEWAFGVRVRLRSRGESAFNIRLSGDGNWAVLVAGGGGGGGDGVDKLPLHSRVVCAAALVAVVCGGRSM